MLASEDPLSYIFHILSYVTITSPAATELEKTNRLIDGLPRALRSYFARGTPDTGQAFTDRLKSVAVEHAYKQGVFSTSSTSGTALAALATANTATASSQALQNLTPTR